MGVQSRIDNDFRNALEGARLDELSALNGILEGGLPSESRLARQSEIVTLWNELSYLGSNDIAYFVRGLNGVPYAEILEDVCDKLRVEGVRDGASVLERERALISKIFADAWDHMSESERELLLKSINIVERDVRVGGVAATTAILAGELGGFATYRIALLVANSVARALLGRGLAVATNATVTRALSVVVGPVGWIASGLWLAADISSPAFRKTVPAVIQVAALRQVTLQREIIGVIGHGSVGKSSLISAVFGNEVGSISPIPGSTKNAQLYDAVDTEIPVRVQDFPGFGDMSTEREEEVEELVRSCTVLLCVFDAIPKRDELSVYHRYAGLAGRRGPIEIVPIFNKWDKVDDDERGECRSETEKRLSRSDLLFTSLKRGKPGYLESIRDVRNRLNDFAARHGRPRMFGPSAFV